MRQFTASSSKHLYLAKSKSRRGELLGPRFHSGIVLYDGEHVLPFGERLLAVPLSSLRRPATPRCTATDRPRRRVRRAYSAKRSRGDRDRGRPAARLCSVLT